MSGLGAVAAAVTGFFTGWNPQAMMAAYSLGSGVDSYINAPNQVGPRLEDLRTQMSTYGAPIPFEWGVNRHAGTIIWPRILEAVEHEHSESVKGGPESTTFTYTMSFAVLLCEGPITGIRRIWANKRLIYDVTAGNTGPTEDPALGTMRVYLGAEDQVADPLIEATDGPSPAYRGYAYVVFEDYDVTEMQGRPPQFEFEIIIDGEVDFSPSLTLLDSVPAGTSGTTQYQSTFDFDRGRLWVHNGTKDSLAASTGGSADGSCINVYDLAARTRLAIISPGSGTDFGDLVYDTDRQLVYAGGEYTTTTGLDPNGATSFFAETMALYGYVLRSLHTPGEEWPARPGTLARAGSLGYLSASSSTHVGTGVCLWSPTLGSYARTDDIQLWWKTQAFSCSNGRIALITKTTTGTGLLLVIPDPAFINTYHPQSEFGDSLLNHIAEDTSRAVLLICAGQRAYTVDLGTETVTEFFDAGASSTALFSIYDSRSDMIYIITRNGAVRTIHCYDPDLGVVTNTFNLAGMGDDPTEMLLSPVWGEIVVVGQTSVWLLSGLYSALVPGTIQLSTIVSDICLRAGLEAGDINVTALTDGVDGYVIGRQMTARAAIEPLQTAFFFDAVEREDKIAFVMRSGGAVTTIPIDDRAARENGQEPPDALAIMREFELELPYQCEVEYPDVDADHLIGTQYDRRITTQSRQKLTIALPIVMSAERAKKIARTALYEAWQKQSFQWTTSRKYAHLEPTDIVALPTAAASYQARISNKREQPSGVIEWEGRITALDVYAQTGADAAPVNYVTQSIYNPGDTILELLDIPMLRDDDNNAGFYIAMGGTEPGWRGAQLYRSTDGGANYDALMAFTAESTIGTTTGALADFTTGNIFDEGNTVTVWIRCGTALTSATEDQVLNGSNKASIGANGRWEIIHFKTATLVGVDTYRLSGLLRGCRGTEWATGTHLPGDSFVLASVATWDRLNAGDTGLLRHYKAPPLRVRLDDVVAETLTNTSIALKPFSPVDAAGTRNVSNDLAITWARRTRLAAGTLHLPVLLGETTEAYEIDIVLAGVVVRTITSATQTATYLASQQTTDGITPGNAVTLRIYQLSAAVGRGYPLETTL